MCVCGTGTDFKCSKVMLLQFTTNLSADQRKYYDGELILTTQERFRIFIFQIVPFRADNTMSDPNQIECLHYLH